MLPPYIIEQIRQREERARRDQENSRPQLELPVEQLPARPKGGESVEEDDPDRGVVIVDLMS